MRNEPPRADVQKAAEVLRLARDGRELKAARMLSVGT